MAAIELLIMRQRFDQEVGDLLNCSVPAVSKLEKEG